MSSPIDFKEIVSELPIKQHREFLEKLLPLNGGRKQILKEMKNFLNEILPLAKEMTETNSFVTPKHYLIEAKVNLFLQQHFPKWVAEFFNTPPIETIKRKKINSAPIFSEDLCANLIKTLLINEHTSEKNKVGNRFVYQYKFLSKVYQCLADYGLHPSIQNRDKEKFSRYNVLIEYRLDSKQTTEILLLTSLEKVKKSIIEPFKNGLPILINGRKIQNQTIEKLTITSTLYKDEEIRLFKERESLKTDSIFIKACTDETNQLLEDIKPCSIDLPKIINPEVPFIGKLMHNLNTSQIVLDAYYSIVPQPHSRENVSPDYIGKLNWYNKPFSVSIHGAYPLMIDWELLNAQIESGIFEQEGISRDEIEAYLIKYAEGFIKGFWEFEKDIVDHKSKLFNTPEDKEQIIFDHATGSFFTGSGFPKTYGNDKHLLSGWEDAGKNAGYFYKSWYIILEHSNRFEKMFTATKDSDQFIDRFIKGINELQNQSESHDFITALKSGQRKDEAAFRNWFKTYFSGSGFQCEAEPLKGNGRIDLKIRTGSRDIKIVEFKGWWNQTKGKIAQQALGYLTDFETTSYILLINHLKKDIIKTYQPIITSAESNYIPGSWINNTYENSNFEYFISEHQFGNKKKRLVHFIYSLYP